MKTCIAVAVMGQTPECSSGLYYDTKFRCICRSGRIFSLCCTDQCPEKDLWPAVSILPCCGEVEKAGHETGLTLTPRALAYMVPRALASEEAAGIYHFLQGAQYFKNITPPAL